MKAIIFPTFRNVGIAAGSQKTVLASIVGRDDAAIIATEINSAADTAFAVECSSAKIGNVWICFEIKRGKPFFTITEQVEVSPSQTIDLGDIGSLRDAKNFVAPMLKGFENANEITVEEGGKNTRITAGGAMRYGGRLTQFEANFLAKSLPVLGLIKISQSPRAALV